MRKPGLRREIRWQFQGRSVLVGDEPWSSSLDFTQECPSSQPSSGAKADLTGTNKCRDARAQRLWLPGATPLVSDPAASGTQASDPCLVSVQLLPASLPDACRTGKEDPWFLFLSVFFRLQRAEPLTQLLIDWAIHLEALGFARGTVLPIHTISSN